MIRLARIAIAATLSRTLRHKQRADIESLLVRYTSHNMFDMCQNATRTTGKLLVLVPHEYSVRQIVQHVFEQLVPEIHVQEIV